VKVHILFRWKPRILAQSFFLLAGVLAVGYVASVYAESFIHQADESRNFERALAQSPQLAPKTVAELSETEPAIRPRIGSMIGKIWIPRLGITAIVDEGINHKTLSLSVGHIPSTALPGQSGNIGIAGHRDTFFRSLRHIEREDMITLTTLRGEFRYRVVSIKVVGPSDVAVLEADGGSEILTLVTCYPFYYVGSAPDRFIVRAERVT
jgi:sortase A